MERDDKNYFNNINSLMIALDMVFQPKGRDILVEIRCLGQIFKTDGGASI